MLKTQAFVNRLSILVLCIGLGVMVSSCSDSPQPSDNTSPPPAATKTVGTQAVPPNPTAGAEYMGVDTCTVCHRKAGQGLRNGTHGVGGTGPNACETCHGPGSLHVEGKGDKTKIIQGKDVKKMRGM